MSEGAVLVGLLVALAVAVVLLPPRRERPADLLRGDDGAGAGRLRCSAKEVEIGLLLTEVSTLLRAGATPHRAWSRALARAGVHDGAEPGPDGVPPALRDLGEVPPGALHALRRLATGSSWGGRGGAAPPDPAPPARGAAGWTVPDLRPGWRARRERRRATAAAVPGAVAACRLTAALGAPLAGVLESVSESVAESGRAEASRRTALAGPRSTARLLALLPIVGLVLGAAVGAQPWRILLDGGWGSALGLLGLILMVAGHMLTARLVAAAVAAGRELDEALVLDLTAAALDAGASLPGALQALGAALEEEALAVVGRALLLGAGWEEAWVAAEPVGAPGALGSSVRRRGRTAGSEARGRWRGRDRGRGGGRGRGGADGRRARALGAVPWRSRRARLEACLRPGWEDGASPGPLLAGAAASLRAGRRAAQEEAAERLAVRLVVPLGLCFLPAFVVLGIVPVVIGVGVGMVGG